MKSVFRVATVLFLERGRVDGRVKILFHRRTCINFAAVAGSGSTWRTKKKGKKKEKRKKGKKRRRKGEKNVASSKK